MKVTFFSKLWQSLLTRFFLNATESLQIAAVSEIASQRLAAQKMIEQMAADPATAAAAKNFQRQLDAIDVNNPGASVLDAYSTVEVPLLFEDPPPPALPEPDAEEEPPKAPPKKKPAKKKATPPADAPA